MGYRIKSKTNGVTVEFYDVPGTMNRLVNNNKVGLFTAATWERYFSKYVPMDSGILTNTTSRKPWQVTYESPYAHYQWQGILYVSPSTGSPWALPNEIKVPTSTSLNYDKSKHADATSHWEEAAYKANKTKVAAEISAYILSGLGV